jgi:hypothetical protein
MSYNKIEIEAIFTACHTEEEVMESCVRFRYLMMKGAQNHLHFIYLVSTERIKYLIYNKPPNPLRGNK